MPEILQKAPSEDPKNPTPQEQQATAWLKEKYPNCLIETKETVGYDPENGKHIISGGPHVPNWMTPHIFPAKQGTRTIPTRQGERQIPWGVPAGKIIIAYTTDGDSTDLQGAYLPNVPLPEEILKRSKRKRPTLEQSRINWNFKGAEYHSAYAYRGKNGLWYLKVTKGSGRFLNEWELYVLAPWTRFSRYQGGKIWEPFDVINPLDCLLQLAGSGGKVLGKSHLSKGGHREERTDPYYYHQPTYAGGHKSISIDPDLLTNGDQLIQKVLGYEPTLEGVIKGIIKGKQEMATQKLQNEEKEKQRMQRYKAEQKKQEAQKKQYEALFANTTPPEGWNIIFTNNGLEIAQGPSRYFAKTFTNLEKYQSWADQENKEQAQRNQELAIQRAEEEKRQAAEEKLLELGRQIQKKLADGNHDLYPPDKMSTTEQQTRITALDPESLKNIARLAQTGLIFTGYRYTDTGEPLVLVLRTHDTPCWNLYGLQPDGINHHRGTGSKAANHEFKTPPTLQKIEEIVQKYQSFRWDVYEDTNAPFKPGQSLTNFLGINPNTNETNDKPSSSATINNLREKFNRRQ